MKNLNVSCFILMTIYLFTQFQKKEELMVYVNSRHLDTDRKRTPFVI